MQNLIAKIGNPKLTIYQARLERRVNTNIEWIDEFGKPTIEWLLMEKQRRE